jgi:hypothetical protein
MNILDQIKIGIIDLSEFNEDQIIFINALVKRAYNEGYTEGKLEIKNIIIDAIELES